MFRSSGLRITRSHALPLLLLQEQGCRGRLLYVGTGALFPNNDEVGIPFHLVVEDGTAVQLDNLDQFNGFEPEANRGVCSVEAYLYPKFPSRLTLENGHEQGELCRNSSAVDGLFECLVLISTVIRFFFECRLAYQIEFLIGVQYDRMLTLVDKEPAVESEPGDQLLPGELLVLVNEPGK